MNINIKLPNELEEKIAEEANKKLTEIIDDILANDEELDELIKKTIQSQVNATALRILQGQELRGQMVQKVYPIIYKILGQEEK